MKNIFFLLLLLAACTTNAQTFQGTLTWSVKYDITDPAKKAEMERQQKQMNDPANQEKMKKMQEQMNSPEMKKMMEANPAMKERMEMAMKAMQGGGTGSMLPSSLIVKTNGVNSLTKMEGGVMAMEMLYLAGKNQAYSINRSAKTYSVLPSGNSTEGKRDSIQHKVTKTAETMKILGYTCTKYIVELTTEKGALHQIFWTTTDIKGLDLRSMSRQRMGAGGQSFYYEGLAGVPLRVEMPNLQMNMVMEVTDIKRESLPATDFAIPEGFTETKGFGK